MIRAFRTGSEKIRTINPDSIYKITNIAFVILSENSLNNAEKIYKNIVKKNAAGNIREFSEIINVHFFIEDKKNALIGKTFNFIGETNEETNRSKGLFNKDLNRVILDIKLYKKLSDNHTIKILLGEYDYVIFFLAVGAVVRLITPYIKDKFTDPGIIAIDEAGKFVVSLLSGHIGGANRFTEDIAESIEGSIPVITTATDTVNRFSLDMFAEKFDLVIENKKEKILEYNMSSIEGKKFEIVLENMFRFGEVKSYIGKFSNAENINVVGAFDLIKLNKAKVILVSAKDDSKILFSAPNLVILRPKRFVVGIGCNKKTSFEEIEKFVSSVFKENNLSLNSIRNIASIDIKEDEIGLLDFGFKYGRFIDFYSKDEINTFMDSGKMVNKTAKTKESVSFKYTGAYSVCEPCALLSAKNEAKELLIPKQKKGNVTMAVAVIYK